MIDLRKKTVSTSAMDRNERIYLATLKRTPTERDLELAKLYATGMTHSDAVPSQRIVRLYEPVKPLNN